MKHLIEAALFDLDGVVVFTDKYHYLAWKRLADEQGWAFDEQLNHQLRGIPRMASLQVILDHNRVSLSDQEKEALADRKNGYYKELLGSINEDDLYPGVVPFMERLRAQGTKLCLCSSSKNARTVLDKLDLARFFDGVVTGHDFRKAKPDPEIFLLGAERLGVPAFHCIVFEDAYSGVEAGLAARMRVIGVGAKEVLTNAPETIRSYDEIDVEALLDSGRPARITPEPWTVAETKVNPARAQYWESLLALTNGFMGLRGTYEEDDPALADFAYPGMFLNGIYDYEPYHHLISFPGYPQRRHVMLNLCDWRIINLIVDGQRFSMFSGKVSEYRRELDLRKGVVTRSLVWESPAGRRVRIRTTRLVSMVRRHSAAIRYDVTPLDSDVHLVFESVVHGKARSGELKEDHVEIVDQGADGDACYFVTRPKIAQSRVGMAFAHRINAPAGQEVTLSADTTRETVIERFALSATKDEAVALDKHACFYSSVETAEAHACAEAVAGVEKNRADGFELLLAEQSDFWRRYWDVADIEIQGNMGDQQAVRLAMFHLRQSNPEDDYRSISACGMTGDHYWGHVFWDTEMYISPHFIYTQPETVRPLLMYRYHLLDQARRRAREMGGIGALYSWNSISGEECGVVYEASTAEYHLVSDIAYALWRYVAATNDREFLYRYGAEMLFETARFLSDRGKFIPVRGNQFCINVVCGPDEYGCGINNNCYTNVLAQWHFRYACRVYDDMRQERPEQFAELSERIRLQPEDRQLWQRAADNMYVPYSSELGIHEQDDSFLYLDPVDIRKLPRFTDLRNYTHPLNLWRMQVAKQADVILLMFVLGDQFSPQQKRANYDFYEPRTNHGSSLSPSMHSLVAAEVGRLDDAYIYFRHSAFMDINDFKDNTAGGVHSACLGGTWMAVINGFAGMRDHESGLLFDPTLPAAWESFRFKIRYRGRLIEVTVNRQGASYRLLEGAALRFLAAGRPVELSPANPTAGSTVRLP
jgi:alpha,alpha-trehalose phosphorylase